MKGIINEHHPCSSESPTLHPSRTHLALADGTGPARPASRGQTAKTRGTGGVGLAAGGSGVGQTGGSLNSNAYDPYHAYTADSYISVTVVTAPATQVNGASIAIAVTYTMDEIF